MMRYLFLAIFTIAFVGYMAWSNNSDIDSQTLSSNNSNSAVIADDSTKTASSRKYELPSEVIDYDGDDISDEAVIEKQVNQNVLEENEEEDDFFAEGDHRRLLLYNIHTKEELDVVYWADGEYLPKAINSLAWFLRDWRTNTSTEMDPELYDFLARLYDKVGTQNPVHVISGYRTKKTNDALRAGGGGQARKSQHVLGKAIDIAIPGVSTKTLRDEAIALKKGGVGYYPKSGFVHIDTGPIRQW